MRSVNNHQREKPAIPSSFSVGRCRSAEVKHQRAKPAVRSVGREVKHQRAKPRAGRYRGHCSRRPTAGRHPKQYHAPYEQIRDGLSKAMVKKLYDMCAADNGENLKVLDIWLGLPGAEKPAFLTNLREWDQRLYRGLLDTCNCLQKLNIWPMSKWTQQAKDDVDDMPNWALALIKRASGFILRASKQEWTKTRSGCYTTIECTVPIAPSTASAACQSQNDPNRDCDDVDVADDDDGDDAKYERQPKQRPQNNTCLEQPICTDTLDKVFLAAQQLLKSQDRDRQYRHFMTTTNGAGEYSLSKLLNIVQDPRIHQQGQLSFLTVIDSILLAPKEPNTLTVLQTSVNKSVKRYAIVTDENEQYSVCRLNEEPDIPPQFPSLSRALGFAAQDFVADAESKAFGKYKREFLHSLRVHVQINRTVSEYINEPVHASRIRNEVAWLISKRCDRAAFAQKLCAMGITQALSDALWHDVGGAPLSKTDLPITKDDEDSDDDDLEIDQLNEEIRETLHVGVSVPSEVGNHGCGRAKCDTKHNCKSRRNSTWRTKRRNDAKRELSPFSELIVEPSEPVLRQLVWEPYRITWQRTALIDALWKQEQQRESLINNTRWTLLPCLNTGRARHQNASSLLHCVEYLKPEFVRMLNRKIPRLNETDLVHFQMYDPDKKQWIDLHALCVGCDTDTAWFAFAIALQVKQRTLNAPNEDSKYEDDDVDDEHVQLPSVAVCGIHSNASAFLLRFFYYFLRNGKGLPSSWSGRQHCLHPHRLEVYENECSSRKAMHCVQLMEKCLLPDVDEKQIEEHVKMLKDENYRDVLDEFKQDQTLWREEMEIFERALRHSKLCNPQWSTHVCRLWCIFTVEPTVQQPGPKHCWYMSRTAFTEQSIDIGQIVGKYKIDRFEIYVKEPSYGVFSALKEFLGKKNNCSREKFQDFLSRLSAY